MKLENKINKLKSIVKYFLYDWLFLIWVLVGMMAIYILFMHYIFKLAF